MSKPHLMESKIYFGETTTELIENENDGTNDAVLTLLFYLFTHRLNNPKSDCLWVLHYDFLFEWEFQ